MLRCIGSTHRIRFPTRLMVGAQVYQPINLESMVPAAQRFTEVATGKWRGNMGISPSAAELLNPFYACHLVNRTDPDGRVSLSLTHTPMGVKSHPTRGGRLTLHCLVLRRGRRQTWSSKCSGNSPPDCSVEVVDARLQRQHKRPFYWHRQAVDARPPVPREIRVRPARHHPFVAQATQLIVMLESVEE